MYEELCSYENIFSAFKKVKTRKNKRRYVKRFQRNLKENLDKLKEELTI